MDIVEMGVMSKSKKLVEFQSEILFKNRVSELRSNERYNVGLDIGADTVGYVISYDTRTKLRSSSEINKFKKMLYYFSFALAIIEHIHNIFF